MKQPDFVDRPPRVATMHKAMLVDSEGCELAVVITEISARGFRVRAPETLAIGENVSLRVEKHGDFRAQIRWSLGHYAGGAFLDPAPAPRV